MSKIIFILKCILGFGSVYDYSLCWFSNNYWDLHDYKKDKGGDGIPTHFYTYRCHNCGEEFRI